MPSTRTIWVSRMYYFNKLKHEVGIPVSYNEIFIRYDSHEDCDKIYFCYTGPSDDAFSFIEKYENHYLSADLYAHSEETLTFKICIGHIMNKTSDMMMINIRDRDDTY